MKGSEYLSTRPKKSKLHARYAARVEYLIGVEKEHYFTNESHGWEVQDSPLLPIRLGAEGIRSFHETFKSVVPDGKTLKTDIEDVLRDRKGQVVGVEIGGLGSKVFNGFAKDFFAETFAFVLFDSRSTLQKTSEVGSRHRVIAGNVASDKIRQQIERLGEAKKIDLIVERMMGGLFEVPQDLLFLNEQFSLWYRMLSEGGLMYLQVPKFATKLIPLWLEAARCESNGNIVATSGIYEDNDYGSTAVIRVNKLPGAPVELPTLSLKQIKEFTKVFKT